MSGWAATERSQRLAHSSTSPYAGRLNFRVRDGYGCLPAALAALTPTDGLEPSLPFLERRVSIVGGDLMRGSFHHRTRAIQLPPEPVFTVAPVFVQSLSAQRADPAVTAWSQCRVSATLHVIRVNAICSRLIVSCMSVGLDC